jgi:hypothetical protein
MKNCGLDAGRVKKLFPLKQELHSNRKRYLLRAMTNIPKTKYNEEKAENKRTIMSQKNICESVANSMK